MLYIVTWTVHLAGGLLSEIDAFSLHTNKCNCARKTQLAVEKGEYKIFTLIHRHPDEIHQQYLVNEEEDPATRRSCRGNTAAVTPAALAVREREKGITEIAHLHAVYPSRHRAPRTADGTAKDGVQTHSRDTNIPDGVRTHLPTNENSSE